MNCIIKKGTKFILAMVSILEVPEEHQMVKKSISLFEIYSLKNYFQTF